MSKLSDFISGGGGRDFIYVSTNHTAENNQYILADTSSGAISITLPASPSEFSNVTIVDYSGTIAFNNISVLRNGSSIQDVSSDITLANSSREVMFIYHDATWNVYTQEMNIWQSPTNIFINGPDTGNELETIDLTIINWDSGSTYTVQVSGGSFSRTLDIVSWTLPSVSVDESHTIQVEENDGVNTTNAIYQVQVFNIPLTADNSISITDFSFNDSNDGWSI